MTPVYTVRKESGTPFPITTVCHGGAELDAYITTQSSIAVYLELSVSCEESQNAREPRSLYTVEYEDGEMIDDSGDGGFSVFTDKPSAQDCLDTTESSGAEGLRIARYAEVVTK